MSHKSKISISCADSVGNSKWVFSQVRDLCERHGGYNVVERIQAFGINACQLNDVRRSVQTTRRERGESSAWPARAGVQIMPRGRAAVFGENAPSAGRDAGAVVLEDRDLVSAELDHQCPEKAKGRSWKGRQTDIASMKR